MLVALQQVDSLCSSRPVKNAVLDSSTAIILPSTLADSRFLYNFPASFLLGGKHPTKRSSKSRQRCFFLILKLVHVQNSRQTIHLTTSPHTGDFPARVEIQRRNLAYLRPSSPIPPLPIVPWCQQRTRKTVATLFYLPDSVITIILHEPWRANKHHYTEAKKRGTEILFLAFRVLIELS